MRAPSATRRARRDLRHLAVALLAACGAPGRADAVAARDAALRELFVVREHSRSVVLWQEPGVRGPVFADLPPAAAPDPTRDAPPRAVGGVPVRAVGRRDLEALFRAHPDGWKAFYARWPAAAGLVETSPVRVARGEASLLVARSCGDHCRQAWRVRLRAVGGGWRVTAIAFVPVPGT